MDKEELIERTRSALRRHLADLNDEVDMDGGRIRDPRVLDGMRDAVDALACIDGMSPGGSAAADSTVKGKWTVDEDSPRGSLK